MSESVLVFSADLLDLPTSFGHRSVISGLAAQALFMNHILDSGKLFYMDRAAAETDESFKQLIPYVVLHHADTNSYFVYQRTPKGGESRLHAKYSVGVGGHINPVDGEGSVSYEAAMLRELAEEVGFTPNPDDCYVEGVVYDPSNEVGRVHFGVVHVVNIEDKEQIQSTDPALSHGEFKSVKEMTKMGLDNFENWSKLVIQHIL